MQKYLKTLLTDILELGTKKMTCLADLPDIPYLIITTTAKTSPFILIWQYALGLAVDQALFIGWWSLIMLFNALVGIVTHLKLKTFDWKEFLLNNAIMIILTIAVYWSTIGLVETANNAVTNSLTTALQVATLVYPISKIFKNAHILTNGVFPPEWIVRKLFDFDKNGNLKVFKEMKDE